MKSDFEILKDYILKCPNVGKDTPAMKAALWGLKTEKKRRTPANISCSLPRSGTSTWCWLKQPESNVTIQRESSSDCVASDETVNLADNDLIHPDEIPSSSKQNPDEVVKDSAQRNLICTTKSSQEGNTEKRKRG